MFTRKASMRQKLPALSPPRSSTERNSTDVTVIPRKSDEEKGGVSGIASLAAPRGSAGSAGRLFSNVVPGNMRHTPGTVFGSAALVSGTTVGAGKRCLYLLPWWHPEVQCFGAQHQNTAQNVLYVMLGVTHSGILALPYATQVRTRHLTLQATAREERFARVYS